MHPDRWRQVEDIFHAALARTPGDRQGFLMDACKGDQALLDEVQSLLVDRAETGEHLLEQPAGMPAMPDQTISHYRILEQLGAGGMGVVYKAEDLRLKRLVALKFLPLELTSDREAKRRLMHEAQAASALDHPHICTIYEIEETADGRLFVAMSYYEGETLGQRVERGPLTPSDALAIAIQVAGAAAAAHDSGIVHRDIKPANIMLTRRGEVKLLDFGIAKLESQTKLTQTGTTRGTVAYMAPETIAGHEADARSDVWSIGVVLFEMLIGRRPFDGNNTPALMNAIVNGTPDRLHDLRPELPAAFDEVVARALAKSPADRYGTADALLQALQPLAATASGSNVVAGESVAAHSSPVPRRTVTARRSLVAVAIGAVLVGAVTVGWRVKSRLDVLDAQSRTIPEIRRLVAEDRYFDAMAIASRTEGTLKSDPELAELWNQLSLTRDIKTAPEGARVSIRDAALRSDWQTIGTTPLAGVRLPRGVLRWKFERDGFVTAEFVSPAPALPASLMLARSGEVAGRMLPIPGGDLALWLTGYDNSKAIRTSSYLIDQFEVTNREFKEFVDAGGYAKQDYWKQPFIREGRTMSWGEAMDLFKDPTGRPGPATWEVGTFPKGHDDYPVGGVSWYEAAAYAEFRGKKLPTVYHWIAAAGTGLAADITPLSNIRGSQLQPVGQSQAVSAHGLADVAGNVKEWAWNEQQPRFNRYVLGGAWNEPDYMFLEGEARSPFDRSANVGFRCALYPKAESAPPATFEPIARFVRDYSVEKPPREEIFKVYKELFSYDHTPLDATVETLDDGSKVWRHEKISFNAAYGKERVIAHLFLPKERTPPYQLVLYWPGSGVIRAPAGDRMETVPWDFLVTSGRAVLVPIYYGTYERNDGARRDSWPDVSRAYRDWAIKQVQDARRALDYVDTRTDLARAGVGYLGYSWGGRMGPVLLAQEPRLKAAVLGGGGLSPGPAPPEVDGLTFAPRVSIPVLMFNGASDLIFQLEQGQKPLFNALGTAAENKRHTVLPGGHTVFIEKRSQFIREALDWFDRYLGPVH